MAFEDDKRDEDVLRDRLRNAVQRVKEVEAILDLEYKNFQWKQETWNDERTALKARVAKLESAQAEQSVRSGLLEADLDNALLRVKQLVAAATR